MAGTVAIGEAEEGLDVKVDCDGFERDEKSWEPLKPIWEGARQVVTVKLWKLGRRCLIRSKLATAVRNQVLIFFRVGWAC